MLDRTFSITRLVSPALSYRHFKLRKPISKEASLRDTADYEARIKERPASEQDLGALIVGVYAIWDDVIKYLFETSSNSITPPWQPGSDLATIEYKFADFEPGKL